MSLSYDASSEQEPQPTELAEHLPLGYRALLENMPAAAYLCDRKGMITYFNSMAEELWGRAPKLNDPVDRFCGSFKLYSADGAPIRHEQCWMARALQTGQEHKGEEIIVERPDGSRITALAHANPLRDTAGNLVGAMNVLVDISARKKAEQDLLKVKDELAVQLADMRRLQELSVRLSTSLELQPILEDTLRMATAVAGTDMGLLALVDGEQLSIGAVQGLKLSLVESMQTLWPSEGDCGSALRDRKRVVIEDTETDPRFEPLRELARRCCFQAVHSTPLVTRGGRVVGVLSMHFRERHAPSDREKHLIDVIARQAVDFIENAQLYKQLREADQRKDEFLAILAHELRNPLAPIANSLHLLRLSDDLSPSVAQIRDVLERQVHHIVRLVDDLMEISRITSGKVQLRKERIELAQIVDSAVEASRPHIDAAGHQLAISLPREPVSIEADPVRLAQVVSNLLNNAAKYTPPGGQIWLTARANGSEATVSVRDTGVGIPTESLPRVFDMFAQVDRSLRRSQGGLGIGLSLAKSFMELHQGRIEVKSDGLNQGSEFTIAMPQAESLPTPLTSRMLGLSPKHRAPKFPNHQILVVDDTRDALYVVSRMLETMGQTVRTAGSGKEALALVSADRFNLIISDIGMPDMDGYELARHLRNEPGIEETMLVALTGYGQESDRQGAIDAGFDRHLVKPVSFAALEALLEALPAPRSRQPR